MTTTRYTRAALFDNRNASGDRVPVVISTTEPVDRDGIAEILLHDSQHVDLSRAPLPLLVAHDHQMLPVGVIEDIEVDGQRARGFARFSDNPMAQALLADVKAGILRSVSVGYIIKNIIRRTAEAVYCSWQPFEVSAVSVPADRGAGFFRSSERTIIMENHDSNTENLSRSQRRAASREEIGDLERRDTIRAIGDQYRKYLRPDDAADACRRGDTVEQFKEFIMNRMQSPHTDTSVPHRSGEVREWDNNVRRYSLGRAIQTITDPAAAMRAGGGLEREMSEEIARRTGRGPMAGGILVPDEIMYGKRAIAVGTNHTSGAGALHIETFAGQMFADAFRAKTIVGALGARVLMGETGDMIIPRKSAVSTMAWVAEAGSATESTALDFNQLVLKPKRISTYVVVSRQSLIQAGIDLEYLIRDDLMQGMFVELDRVALAGAGTGSEPTGIVNTSGIGTTTAGANGAVIAYSHLVDLEASVANANAAFGASGYAVNPKTRAYLKKSAKIGTAVTELAWNDAALSPDGIGIVCGHRAGVTTNLRSNLTKGTSTTVCSELVFGSDWSELVIARFGGSEVTVDPYSLATTGQVRITLNGFADVGVRRAGAFAKLSDALTA